LTKYQGQLTSKNCQNDVAKKGATWKNKQNKKRKKEAKSNEKLNIGSLLSRTQSLQCRTQQVEEERTQPEPASISCLMQEKKTEE
jgi:hypothetical protein